MAFLHSASTEALRTELDLWAIPPTQTVLEGGQWAHYKPVTSIEQSNTIEFCVPGTGDEYIDPAHTLLLVKGKIVKEDNSDFIATDANDAAPANYLLHTLWSQVDVALNQKLISQSSMTYSYRSYMESLLAYDTTAKNSHMSMRMWYTWMNLHAVETLASQSATNLRKTAKSLSSWDQYTVTFLTKTDSF